MTFWSMRRRRGLAQYKRAPVQRVPERFDAVRLLAPVFTVLVAVAVGLALGRFV